MDGERRRRVAKRFAMDDLPCGIATGAYRMDPEGATWVPDPGQVSAGRGRTSEAPGEASGGALHGQERQ